MAKGITYSCAHVWRGIARAGGWWSLLRVAREWDGVFGMAEIEEHLTTLKRGGFLAAMEYHREGTVYAYTPQCRQLPGESLMAVTQQPQPKDTAQAVEPDAHAFKRARMKTTYEPPQPTYRPGALDYAQCPSLHMGQRRAFRSDAAAAPSTHSPSP